MTKNILARAGTAGSLSSWNPSSTPSHMDLIDSAASSASCCCFVQNSEFSYHSLKRSNGTSLDCESTPISLTASSISGSVMVLPRLRSSLPTSWKSIPPDLFSSNFSKSILVSFLMRFSLLMYHSMKASLRMLPLPEGSISLIALARLSADISESDEPSLVSMVLNSSGSMAPELFESSSENTSFTSPLIRATQDTAAVSITSFFEVSIWRMPARNVVGRLKPAFGSSFRVGAFESLPFADPSPALAAASSGDTLESPILDLT
mmetsp:Transcript_2295/g.4916  ORF Transcript_2295/g.4916 Transcript_2295/m.4916 type:complete len:263 (-) Transcript_2295:1025-1813(-)